MAVLLFPTPENTRWLPIHSIVVSTIPPNGGMEDIDARMRYDTSRGCTGGH